MGLLTALGPLAIDMYLPAFPAIATGLDTSINDIERTLASYLVGISLAQLVYGPVADRYGRRKPLLFGLVLFAAASLACALAGSVAELTAWRVVQAFGGAACMVVPRAVIRDRFDTRDASKALSLLMLIMGATPILAPVLGSQILLFADWRWIFGIMTACSAGLLAWTALAMRETLDPACVQALHPRSIIRNYMQLCRHRGFMLYSLAGGMGGAGMFAYIAGAARTFIGVYGVEPAWFAFYFGIIAAALIAAAQLSARMLNRHTPQTLMRHAQRLQAASGIAVFLLAVSGLLTLPLLIACLIGYMVSQGFVNPNSAALSLTHQGHRLGTASALMGAMRMGTGALAGAAISLWPAVSALPLATVLAACAVSSWLFGRKALSTP